LNYLNFLLVVKRFGTKKLYLLEKDGIGLTLSHLIECYCHNVLHIQYCGWKLAFGWMEFHMVGWNCHNVLHIYGGFN
jgi:hypothetical protein